MKNDRGATATTSTNGPSQLADTAAITIPKIDVDSAAVKALLKTGMSESEEVLEYLGGNIASDLKAAAAKAATRRDLALGPKSKLDETAVNASMDAFTAVSSSLDLGPSARSRRVAALAAAALRSDAMFPPRYSRTSSLSDMPVFNNAFTAAESTSIFGMVIAAVSASWDGPFVDVVAVAPRSFFILAGKPASWAVDSAGGFSGPAELARGESGRTSGVCLKARRSHVCRSVRVRSVRVRRGSRTRSLAGPRAMGPVRFDASSSPFFLGRLSGRGERFTTNEESGSANRILASLWF